MGRLDSVGMIMILVLCDFKVLVGPLGGQGQVRH